MLLQGGFPSPYLGSMQIISRPLSQVLGVLLVAAVACQDSTAPRKQSPLVGRWDVTTVFNQFSFETGAPSPPDCPGFSVYCTHHRTTTSGATYSGVLDVRDTSSTMGTAGSPLVATGTFDVSFCDSVDYRNLTGCTHVSPLTPIDYAGTIEVAGDIAAQGSLRVDLGEPDPSGDGLNRQLRSLSVTFAGDSMYGPVSWGTPGRSPPTYSGTLVAHRRK